MPNNLYFCHPKQRGARVVEGARLESGYTGNCIEGSNPFLSANAKMFAPPAGGALSLDTAGLFLWRFYAIKPVIARLRRATFRLPFFPNSTAASTFSESPEWCFRKLIRLLWAIFTTFNALGNSCAAWLTAFRV